MSVSLPPSEPFVLDLARAVVDGRHFLTHETGYRVVAIDDARRLASELLRLREREQRMALALHAAAATG